MCSRTLKYVQAIHRYRHAKARLKCDEEIRGEQRTNPSTIKSGVLWYSASVLRRPIDYAQASEKLKDDVVI